MPVSRQKKQEVLSELNDAMKSAKSVFFAKNLGLTVKEVQQMRRVLRAQGNSFTIAKKTLLKKAASDSVQLEVDDRVLDGPVGAVFAMEDALSAIKLLAKLEKDTKKIEITGGIFEGRVLSQADAIALSKLPTRDELLAKLMGSMLAPVTGFVTVNSQLIAGFVRVLDGYREKQNA